MAVMDQVLSHFPCHQVNFWAKVIPVLVTIQTGVSILKTISGHSVIYDLDLEFLGIPTYKVFEGKNSQKFLEIPRNS